MGGGYYGSFFGTTSAVRIFSPGVFRVSSLLCTIVLPVILLALSPSSVERAARDSLAFAGTISSTEGSTANEATIDFIPSTGTVSSGTQRFITGTQDFVINEILYDPEGPDDGLEFVELYNPTDISLSLKGLVLETGNGATEGNWSLAMQWESDYYVDSHGYALIGEDAVSPTPQFVKVLDLQNGPDGCRIRRGSQIVDIVGWGLLAFAEYYEGSPCEDVASGISLGRLPDGIDTQNNSNDLRALSPPSPGRRNLCLADASLVTGTLATTPALPVPFEKTQLMVEVANFGALEIADGECLVEFFGTIDSARTLLASSQTRAIASRQKGVVTASWVPQVESCMILEAILRLANDENAGNDTASMGVRIGEGDIVINEIMFAPAAGEPEWVELFNRGQVPIDVCGWTLEDSSRKKVRLTSLPILILPGEFLIVSQDKGLIENKSVQCAGHVIEPEGSWPSLNNSSSGGSVYADVVCVRDSSDCISDYVAYEEDWSTRSSASIERVSASVSSREGANWSSSVTPAGATPCERNSVTEASRQGSAFRLAMSNRIISPDGDGVDDRVVFSFTLPSPGMRANLTIFDSDGRTTRRLLDQRKVGTVVQTIWDGIDEEGKLVPPGVYIVNLGVKTVDGGWEESRSTLVVSPRRMR